MKLECPVCHGSLKLRDPEPGDIVQCGGCGSESVVTPDLQLEECLEHHE